MNAKNKWNRITRRLFIVSLIAALFTLQGCSNSNDPPPVVNATPTGYYDDTGFADDKQSDDTTARMFTDLQGAVQGNRLMMMSDSEKLLYDGSLTITESNFTGTVTIYENGQNPFTVTMSGTITEGSKIPGTMTGAGAGNGTFTLNYALSNNTTAAISRIETNVGNPQWVGIYNDSTTVHDFELDAAGKWVHRVSATEGFFDFCGLDGDVTPISGTSLYSLSIVVSSCNNNAPRGNYTGLATTKTNADTTFVAMFSNGSYSFSVEYQ